MDRRKWKGIAVLFPLLLLGSSTIPSISRAAAITSNGSGLWSLAGTWIGGVPTAADTVTIRAGDTVTLDITTATARATTINGTLSFSRVSSSSFTVVGGDVTVNAGGTLDIGTPASPIPSGVRAHLVLALGASAGQYGLIVNNGGNFTVRGSTKTPATTATTSITPVSGAAFTAVDVTGWSVGDEITIAPTQGNGLAATERRFIAAIAGNNVTMNAAASNYHYSTGTIRVGALTSNVLVRSSGTVVQGAGGNSAYIRNLAQYTTSFSLLYGEVAYLGANVSPKYGITFDGSGTLGLISSSTLRDGYDGVYLNFADNNTLSGNLVYNNAANGIFVGANETTLTANDIYGNDTGISLSVADRALMRGNAVHSNGSCSNCGKAGIFSTSDSNNSTLNSNRVYSNADTGIGLCAGSNSATACSNTLTANNSYANGGQGITVSGTGSLLSGNSAYRNAQTGLYFAFSATNTSVANNTYSNGNSGVTDWDGYGNVFVEDRLGYDSAGNSLPDAGEIAFIASGHRLKCLGARINGGGPAVAGFDRNGNSLISYNQDYATGTVRIWGDYAISGTTLTLDHALQLYASTATAPKLMFGAGHAASVLSTNDANAVSQIVTLRRVAGAWQVVGSSTGLMGSFAGSIVNQPFPAGAAQFNLSFTQGGSPRDGDSVDFALIAASGDASRQKRLIFGPSAAAQNRGRSRLTVAPSGGVVLRGIAGTHTLMDMLPGGTYYTFIDSGAFTANFSSITNTDPGGVQLSGSAGVSLSNAVFDYMGIADATNTYITARALSSVASYSAMSFGVSRSTQSYAYNVLVTGADAGLNWQFNNPPGGNLWGEAFNADPNGRVSWGSGNTAPSGAAISGVQLTSFTITFTAVAADAYVAQASTAADFTGTLFISSTASQSGALPLGGLAQNTTYYARVGALWGSTTFYADAGVTATLAAAAGPINFTGITGAGFTLNWQQNANPAGTQYQAAVSTDINFGILTSSLTTTGFNLTMTGLSTNATFYARVRAVNWSGTLTGDALGVVITAGGVITISANRLASVWYNTLAAVFNAQGAATYHYLITAGPADLPGAGDPVFNGSALSTTVLQGASYFHIWGRDAGGASLGYAHFGPMDTDTATPVIASISAQTSATDASAIADGGATVAATPRFTWPAAASDSPIVGYAFGVSADPAVLPTTVTTTLSFADHTLTTAGLYYAKVRALNLAGSLGPVVGMSFTFNTVPASSGITIKRNYFNPLRGECLQLVIAAPGAGRQKAVVYTMLGETVSTLIDSDQPAGIFNYSWCATTGSGRAAATGVYLLHIESPGQKRDVHIAVAK